MVPSLEELFAAFPEWRELAGTETAEDGSVYRVVKVAPPSGADVQHGLTIDTANEEITVWFDYFHSHFDEWTGDESPFGPSGALDFIQQLVIERVSVISWWSDDRWCGSSLLDAGAAPDLPSWSGAQSCTRVRVRSWTGKLNADIQV